MNANDGSSSNLASSNENKKNTKESIENENENSGEEVVINTDATNCDIKILEGWKNLLKLFKRK